MPGFDTLAEGAGKLLGAIPELYDDLAKPAVQEVGKTLALPLQAVNALLINPRKWIANAEYKLQETNALIANRLKYTDENKLVSPLDFVAVPALQALSYSMDSSELRNLYANLLAKSMNTDTRDTVHPAYVEIIKQLSPLDAQIFRYVVANRSADDEIGFATVDILSNNNTIQQYKNIVIGFEEADLSRVSESIDNLMRCGLIAIITNALWDIDDNDNNSIVQMKTVQSEIPEGLSARVSWITPAYVTELGKNFYLICCED